MPISDPVVALKKVLKPQLEDLRTNHRVTTHQSGFGVLSPTTSYIQPGFDRLDYYVRGIQDNPYRPKEATEGYQSLMDRSKLNMMDLVVNYRAQSLKVEGYKDTTDPDSGNSPAWDKYWQKNKMDRRQLDLWRTVFTFGIGYAVPEKAVDPLSNKSMIQIGLYSPRDFVALYEDPALDDWPVAALRLRCLPGVFGEDTDDWEATIWDDTNIYVLQGDDGQWDLVSTTAHGMPVCPVVRFVDEMDLEGRVRGQIEPLINLQNRLNQSCFDLLMTETFAAFRVRYVTGVMFGEVSEADSEPSPELLAEANRRKMQLAADRLLAFPDADTKVGDLPEGNLEQLIQVVQQNIRIFAIKSQTPPQDFLGDVGGNISADALSALEASSAAKTREKQKSFGESVEQLLRLCALLDGDKATATDDSSQVIWGQPETRSLAQVADAYGKIASLLQVPVEELWQYIPDVTQQDIDRWKIAKKRADALNLAQQLAVNVGGVNDIVQPAAPGQPAGSGGGSSGGVAGSTAQRNFSQSAVQSKPSSGPGRPVGS